VSVNEKCKHVRSGDSDEEGVGNLPIPSFGEAVSSFEVFRRYLCIYKISDARLGTFGERTVVQASHSTNIAGITVELFFKVAF
jgi:hypothetical protein